MDRRIAIRLVLATALLAAPALHARAQTDARENAAQEAAATDAPTRATPDGDETRPGSLFELLEMVEHGMEQEKQELRKREREFIEARDRQKQILAEAEATLKRKEDLSRQLEEQYNQNEGAIAESEERLSEQLGQLGELFGVVRQVATETRAQVWDSLTSSQLGQRKELLDRLGRSKELPTTDDLERLWFELTREMTE